MSEEARRPRRSRVRRRVIAAAVGLGTLLVVLSLLTLLIDPSAVARRMARDVIPDLEDSIGRQIKVEGITVRILPLPRVVLTGVEISGRRAEDPPLLTTERAEVGLAVIPLILSNGHDIRITRLDVHHPEVNLIVGGRAGREPPPRQAEAPPDETSKSKGTWVVKRLHIHDGKLRFVDLDEDWRKTPFAMTHADARAKPFGPGRKIDLDLTGAVASNEQNVRIKAKSKELPEDLGRIFVKEVPELRGKISIRGADVVGLGELLPSGLGAVLTNGRVDIDADFRSDPNGALVATGRTDLPGVELRGVPSRGAFDFTLKFDPKEPSATTVEVQNLAMHGPGIDLRGTAAIQVKPATVRFDLGGPVLNLKTMIGAISSQQEEKRPAKRNASLLPEKTRRRLDAVQATGSLRFARVVNGRLELQRMEAQAVLQDGRLKLERARARVFGGTVDASGTTLTLRGEEPEWSLRAKLHGLELKQAMTQLSSGPAPLEGKIDASLSLQGKGDSWAELSPSVVGNGNLQVRDGVLTTADLGKTASDKSASKVRRVEKGLRVFGGGGGAGQDEGPPGATRIGDLSTTFTVRDGSINLEQPLTLKGPIGEVELNGRVGLKQELDLNGQVQLPPTIAAKVLGTVVMRKPGASTVPVEVTGTLQQPSVKVVR